MAKQRVTSKTYWAVMDKYGRRCQHPQCFRVGYVSFNGTREVLEGLEYSHILFRSKYPELTDDPGNGVPLCPEHHRTGKESVHNSMKWRRFYHRFLSDEIKARYNIDIQ